MLGVWVGDAWSGVLPHVLVVESVASDGQATVVYAVGDGPEWKIAPAWSRVTARIADGALSFTQRGGAAKVRYALSPDGRLEGHFVTDRSGALVVLRRVEPATREALAALVAGERYRVEPEQIFIPVKTGAGTEVRLEATLYRPDRSGRFPLVVFNHGSTGGGAFPATRTQTYRAEAHYFVRRGFAVVVPMRKGRGASEGSYDERYGCGPGVVEAGVSSALGDLDGVLDHLLRQPYVDADRVVMAGQSRGGYLSVVYAARGRHRDRLRAVVNFAGGWSGQICGDRNSPGYADAGARSRLPMLWLYGESDLVLLGLRDPRVLRGVREGGRQRATGPVRRSAGRRPPAGGLRPGVEARRRSIPRVAGLLTPLSPSARSSRPPARPTSDRRGRPPGSAGCSRRPPPSPGCTR